MMLYSSAVESLYVLLTYVLHSKCLGSVILPNGGATQAVMQPTHNNSFKACTYVPSLTCWTTLCHVCIIQL